MQHLHGTTVAERAQHEALANGHSARSPGPAALDMHAVAAALLRRWPLVLGFVLVGCGLAVLLARMRTDQYRATAVVRYRDARRALAGALGPQGDGSPTSVNPILSNIPVLRSRAIGGEVVDSLPSLRISTVGFSSRLVTRIQFDSTVGRDSLAIALRPDGFVVHHAGTQVLGTYDSLVAVGGIRFALRPPAQALDGVMTVHSREGAIDHVINGLNVKLRDQTDVLEISYVHPDPATAQAVLNTLAQIFQVASARDAKRESHLRRIFLEEQLRQNDTAVLGAQQSLSAFRSGEQVYSSRDKLTADQGAFAQIDANRDQLDLERRSYRNLLAALKDGDVSDQTMGEAIALAGNNGALQQVVSELSQLRAHRDSLTSGPYRAAEGNPEVRRLDTLMASARSRVEETVRALLASLDARIASLDASRTRRVTEFRSVSGREAQEARLTQQLTALQNLATQLREEYQRARIAEAVEVGQVEIVDLATLPGAPIGTSRRRIVIFGALLGLFAGVVLAVLLDQFNRSIRNQQEVEAGLQLTGLAVIPQARPGAGWRLLPNKTNGSQGERTKRFAQAGLITIADVRSGAAEAYRQLRTSLLFADFGTRLRAVLVTSPGPGEGKTTVAANLAVSFAQQGVRTLLVDCDIRRGRLHDMFRLAQSPGLADLLRHERSIGDVLHHTDIPNLSVLTGGAEVPSPSELFETKQWRERLEELRTVADLVILDSPPLLLAAEAAILAATADGVLLVLRAGRSEMDEARIAVQRLEAINVRLLGAVLNDPDATVRSSVYYHYDSGYRGKR